MKISPKPIFGSYLLICFLLTHLPSSSVPSVSIPHIDKVVHFTLYFGLGFWALRSWKNTRSLGQIWTWILVYAALDEMTQPPFGRTAEIWDWGCDALGSSIPLFFSRLVRPLRLSH